VKQLEKSSYEAKADHLRRLLERTRKIGASRTARKTWLDVFHLLGQLLWTLGVFGQLLWNLTGICGHFLRGFSGIPVSHLPSQDPLIEIISSAIALPFLAYSVRDVLELVDNGGTSMWSPSYYGVTVYNLAKWGFLLSLISFWWNPKFKQGYRGYHRHIGGFYDWYKYQALLLLTRAMFWLAIKYGLFDHIDQSAMVGVHIFMLGFTVGVSI
jgi:hypothetical protein